MRTGAPARQSGWEVPTGHRESGPPEVAGVRIGKVVCLQKSPASATLESSAHIYPLRVTARVAGSFFPSFPFWGKIECRVPGHYNCADSLKLVYVFHARPSTFLFEYFLLRSSSCHKAIQAEGETPSSRRKLRGPHLALGEIHCFPQEVAALCLRASLLTGKGEGVFFVAVDLRFYQEITTGTLRLPRR